MNQPILAHPRLVESLEDAPVIQRGDYDYLIHPLTDGVPRVDPRLLEEATEGLLHLIAPHLENHDIDLLVTAEAMGLPIVTTLAQRTGIPFVIARKRSYGLPGEIPLDQTTGYSHTQLHLNGVKKSDRVIIIDDLISTGGTLRALVAGIHQAQATPLAVAVIVTKPQDLTPLARELGCSIGALAAVEIITQETGKRVQVTKTDVQGQPQ